MTDADNALIPLEVIREKFQIHERTLRRKLTAAGIETVKHKHGRAVRWGDIATLFGEGP